MAGNYNDGLRTEKHRAGFGTFSSNMRDGQLLRMRWERSENPLRPIEREGGRGVESVHYYNIVVLVCFDREGCL